MYEIVSTPGDADYFITLKIIISKGKKVKVIPVTG
jgi:hypothetical protein